MRSAGFKKIPLKLELLQYHLLLDTLPFQKTQMFFYGPFKGLNIILLVMGNVMRYYDGQNNLLEEILIYSGVELMCVILVALR